MLKGFIKHVVWGSGWLSTFSQLRYHGNSIFYVLNTLLCLYSTLFFWSDFIIWLKTTGGFVRHCVHPNDSLNYKGQMRIS